jgi:hypothetical protein
MATAHDRIVELGGALLAALFLALALAGCGGITSVGDDHALDAGADGPPLERPEAGGDAGDAGPPPCLGCVGPGGVCVEAAAQSDDVCGSGGVACAPAAFTCLGMRGACAAGEQLATRAVCGSGGVVRPWCCPANDCELTACHVCTGCP